MAFAMGVFAPWRSFHLWWRGRLGAVLASAGAQVGSFCARYAFRVPGALGPACGFSLCMLPRLRLFARCFCWSLLLLCFVVVAFNPKAVAFKAASVTDPVSL